MEQQNQPKSEMKETSDFFSKELTAEERNLYNRQFRLDGWDQRILKNSRVLIVGVGGLGCEIAKNLAMLGVGHLDLVDLDVIEHSNLNRQVLFVDAPIAQPKAIAAAKMLKKINPNITIKGYHSSLEQLPPVLFKKADVIIGGLDSKQARINLNTQAIRFKKPLVDGGVNQFNGHVYTIFPYENACYECYPTSSTESDEMAACTVVGIPRKRIHCLFKATMAFEEKFGREANAQSIEDVLFIQTYTNEMAEKYGFKPLFKQKEIIDVIDHHEPGIITINAVIASLQSQETLKILFNLRGNTAIGKATQQYIIYNGMTARFYYIDKPRNPECAQCGDHVLRETFYLRKNQPLSVIISALQMKGYTQDEEMEPILTVPDFDTLRVLDLDETAKANRLHSLSLLTLSGFKEGDIYVTIRIFKAKKKNHEKH
jgi:molybdopterin/thiamine biosynthesis adenylyltransferase